MKIKEVTTYRNIYSPQYHILNIQFIKHASYKYEGKRKPTYRDEVVPGQIVRFILLSLYAFDPLLSLYAFDPRLIVILLLELYGFFFG